MELLQDYLRLTAGIFGTHLEMGSNPAPGGLQRKSQKKFPDRGEAGKVDCEGAVVLFSELSPTYLGIHTGGFYIPAPYCFGGGTTMNLWMKEPACP